MGIILAAVETAGEDNCLKDRIPGLTRRSIEPACWNISGAPLLEYSSPPTGIFVLISKLL
jgi:hypothetical protein